MSPPLGGAWVLLVAMSACGTRGAEESLPVNAMETAREAVTQPSEGVNLPAEESSSEAERNPDPVPLPEGSDNFATPHHCHPPEPCELRFETLAGVQYIDVGHGHASAPQLDVVLRVHAGRAQVESLLVESAEPPETAEGSDEGSEDPTADERESEAGAEVQGRVEGRPRSSLEGNAYYIAVDGSARDIVLRITFAE